MERIAVLGMGLFLVSACMPINHLMLYKANTPVSAKQSDLDQCRIASFKQIPQAMVTEVDPGIYDPGFISCYRTRHGYRYCDRVGGMYIAPSSRSYDQNGNLRDRFVEACLKKKSYQFISLPACRSGPERAAALSAKRITELKCNPDPRLDY